MWAPHVTVANIVVKEGRFLMVEEYEDGKRVLNQPAGHLEDNESLIDAVIRETLEESCWLTQPLYALGISKSRTDKGRTYLRHSFVSETLSFDPNHKRDSDILSIDWMTGDEIRAASNRLRSRFVLNDLERYEKGIRFNIDELYA